MDFTGMAHFETEAQPEMLMYDDGSAHYGDENVTYPIASENFEEGYVDAEFQETQTILADGGDQFGVSSIAFDLQEELIWMGNQGGHVTSYYGPGMQKYTSFQVHTNQEVRHVATFDEGILALTQSTLRCQLRRGIPVFTHRESSQLIALPPGIESQVHVIEHGFGIYQAYFLATGESREAFSANMVEMQCLLQVAPSTILMGGHQDKLILFDVSRAEEANVVQVGENGCAILRQHSRFLCTGDPLGIVELRDPVSLKLEHSVEAHTGSLSDFDVHENLLVTCGFSNRPGGMSVDRLLMVYDLRMLRAVSPMQVLLDPLLLRFLPTFSSRLAVVSALGQFQLLDTVALSEPELCLYQTNSTGSMCLTFDVSSSCQCMAFGDSAGSIHLFTSHSSALFNTYSRETEFADPVESLPPINMTDDQTPLATVPMPYCQGPLLSDWPEELLKKVYRTTPPIDQEILKTMKMVGTIGYAPNPGTVRRNQIPYKFEKNGGRGVQKLFAGDARSNKSDDPTFIAIPKRYRKIEVKYSKMGMDDFDFDHYNKTGFSGLEATLPNSYCNAMLQVLYYTDKVRAILLSHLCQREFCLACELGFLFHMVDNSQGFPCQASNFLRAFRTIPEASALGLILSDENDSKKKTNLTRLIQNWNRFILHQIHFEILDAKKRKLYMESVQAETQVPVVEQFVYQEKDFPSILGATMQSSRYRYNKEEEIEVPTEEELKDTIVPESQQEETEVSELFGTRQLNIHKCIRCGREVTKESTQFLWNLSYPEMPATGPEEMTFCDMLKRSLSPEQTTPAWCDCCGKYQPTTQSRRLVALPNILALNCGLDSPQEKMFWQAQMDLLVQKAQKAAAPTAEQATSTGASAKPCRYGDKCMRPGCRFRHAGRVGESTPVSSTHLYYTHSWLPLHIQVQLGEKGEIHIQKSSHQQGVPTASEAGSTAVTEAVGGDVKPSFSPVQTMEYDLCSVVCYIHDPVNSEKKNLVALVNVGPRYHERSVGSPVSQWYIFNDFSITPVQAQEVVWFSLDWKVPCVLYWVNRELRNAPEPLVQNPITVAVFGEDECLARNGRKMITFTPLAADEMPAHDELVAMDAEFVTLNQEESELRSDGKTNTIKPSHMSVARITCIRGQGPLEGTPFIDDYISTQEQVVDYLTKFSGIKPGDLDANFSSKHLTTLKSTYQKLRFLIDNGVKFVGHGLKNDFRVINLVVPSEQVIDTVHLFHLPHHRMVSLRFLTWHFLDMKIQSVTHDSIEDARAALQLYQHYLQLEVAGTVTSALKELYQVGKRLQWKVPGTTDH